MRTPQKLISLGWRQLLLTRHHSKAIAYGHFFVPARLDLLVSIGGRALKGVTGKALGREVKKHLHSLVPVENYQPRKIFPRSEVGTKSAIGGGESPLLLKVRMRPQIFDQSQLLEQVCRKKAHNFENRANPGISILLTSFFLVQAPRWIGTIHEGWSTGHRKSLIQAMHSLKATSGTVGAFQLYDIASRMEAALEKGDQSGPDAFETLLRKLDAEWVVAYRRLRQAADS